MLEDSNATGKELKELKSKYEESEQQDEKLTRQREKYKDIETSFNELKTKYKISQDLIDEKRTRIKVQPSTQYIPLHTMTQFCCVEFEQRAGVTTTRRKGTHCVAD